MTWASVQVWCPAWMMHEPSPGRYQPENAADTCAREEARLLLQIGRAHRHRPKEAVLSMLHLPRSSCHSATDTSAADGAGIVVAPHGSGSNDNHAAATCTEEVTLHAHGDARPGHEALLQIGLEQRAPHKGRKKPGRASKRTRLVSASNTMAMIG